MYCESLGAINLLACVTRLQLQLSTYKSIMWRSFAKYLGSKQTPVDINFMSAKVTDEKQTLWQY